MPLPLAIAEDVEAIWRPLTVVERAAVDGQIRFASAIVRRQVPLVDARLAAGTLDPDLVRGVVASMVQRVLLNPDRNSEVAIDDMRVKKDATVAAGELYISDAELALLRPISVTGSTTAGAFTIRSPAQPFRATGWFPGWFGTSQPDPWWDPYPWAP